MLGESMVVDVTPEFQEVPETLFVRRTRRTIAMPSSSTRDDTEQAGDSNRDALLCRDKRGASTRGTSPLPRVSRLDQLLPVHQSTIRLQ